MLDDRKNMARIYSASKLNQRRLRPRATWCFSVHGTCSRDTLKGFLVPIVRYGFVGIGHPFILNGIIEASRDWEWFTGDKDIFHLTLSFYPRSRLIKQLALSFTAQQPRSCLAIRPTVRYAEPAQ